MITIY